LIKCATSAPETLTAGNYMKDTN